MAARNGHLAIVNRLLEFDAVEQDVASGYNEAFQQAVANGHTPVVEGVLLCPVVLAFEQKYQFRHINLPRCKPRVKATQQASKSLCDWSRIVNTTAPVTNAAAIK